MKQIKDPTTIPCKQCPVLAMCKAKSVIKCTILGTVYSRMPFGKTGRNNNLFMRNVTQFLGRKEWTIYGTTAHIYNPLSEAEERRVWQSIGSK